MLSHLRRTESASRSTEPEKVSLHLRLDVLLTVQCGSFTTSVYCSVLVASLNTNIERLLDSWPLLGIQSVGVISPVHFKLLALRTTPRRSCIGANLSYIMPWNRVYHPVGSLSQNDKDTIAKGITDIYAEFYPSSSTVSLFNASLETCRQLTCWRLPSL